MTGTRFRGEHVTPRQLELLHLVRDRGFVPEDELLLSQEDRTPRQVRQTLEALADKGLLVRDRQDGHGELLWRLAKRDEVRTLELAQQTAAKTARLKPSALEPIDLVVQWMVKIDGLLVGGCVWPSERVKKVISPVYAERAVVVDDAYKAVGALAGDLLLLSPPVALLPQTRWVLAEQGGMETLMERSKADAGKLPITAGVEGVWRPIGS